MRKLIAVAALTIALPTSAFAEKATLSYEQVFNALGGLNALNVHDVIVRDDKGNGTVQHNVPYRFDVPTMQALAHDVAMLTSVEKEYEDVVKKTFDMVKADHPDDVDPVKPMDFKADTAGKKAFSEKMKELNGRSIEVDVTKITMEQLNIGADEDKKNPITLGTIVELAPITK